MRANLLAITLLVLMLVAAKPPLGVAVQTNANLTGTNTLSFEKAQTHGDEDARLVTYFRADAEKGDANAQYVLGDFYAYGQGVPTNYVEAVKWYRKAAEQGNAEAQRDLGWLYAWGRNGVSTDAVEAEKWCRKAAEQGDKWAQNQLGMLYRYGVGGVRTNYAEGARWYRKAAEQGHVRAESQLGYLYRNGEGVERDYNEAAKWFRKAALQGDVDAQYCLGQLYTYGDGVVQDFVEAYKWLNLAAASPDDRPPEERKIMAKYKIFTSGEEAKAARDRLARRMTSTQIAEGQQRSIAFKPRNEGGQVQPNPSSRITDSQPSASGTGFFISSDGFLISSAHVVEAATQVRLVTSAGLISAKAVKVDAANDIALLKAEGTFSALPVAASRGVKLGGTVATVGFPNIGLQGFAPKLAKGEIASLSGAGDDARYFQISVPVQPGNSGGALVDERGNVVGVVSAKLSARAALASSGALPENVNYAIKSSYLLSFLESVPELLAEGHQAKLKEPNTKEKKFEDVVKEAEQAAVLVLVY